jgi:hypothetical protein
MRCGHFKNSHSCEKERADENPRSVTAPGGTIAIGLYRAIRGHVETHEQGY